MATYVYVDNSNLWIEGMHVSAVETGLAPDIWTAQSAKITDRWSYDFGKILEFAGGDSIGRAVLYGSRPPPNDSVWKIAERSGFEVVVYDRNLKNKEKKIDTRISVDITADALTKIDPKEDAITLVAGDNDYVPVAELVQSKGISITLMFWDHAGKELRECCAHFVSLNPYLRHLAV